MRRLIESLPPQVYARTTYYEKWALAFLLALFESDLAITRQDLANHLGSATSESAAAAAGPRFAAGDRVTVRGEAFATCWQRPHLRTPGYIFGMPGVVERQCGAFPMAELLAFGISAPPTPLYRVRFRQAEVWHRYAGQPEDTVEVELYEPWLMDTAAAQDLDTAAATRSSKRQKPTQAPEEAEGGGGQSHHDDGHDHAHGHGDGHEHGHVHFDRAQVEQTALDREFGEGAAAPGPFRRVAEALQALVCDAGIVTADEIRAEIQAQDMNSRGKADAGASVVARAWTDPQFKRRLLEDGKRAVAEMGVDMDCGQLVVVENTPLVHNLVVCTLCSVGGGGQE
jgi:hypothetical protein